MADRTRVTGYPMSFVRRMFDTVITVMPRGTELQWETLGEVCSLRLQRPGTHLDAGVLLYLHGGGYVFGSAKSHGALAAQLAMYAGLAAVVPEYRLAPEHTYPAALDDARAVYAALLRSGVPADRIVIAGDSAGGHLAAALLADLSLSRDMPLPRAAVLMSPLIDLSFKNVVRLDAESRDPFLSPAYGMRSTRAYTAGADAADPRIAVLDADKSSWPPILIQVGGTECLRRDCELMAESFGAGKCRLEVWPGQVHVFQAFPLLPEARIALKQAGRWIREHIASSVDQ